MPLHQQPLQNVFCKLLSFRDIIIVITMINLIFFNVNLTEVEKFERPKILPSNKYFTNLPQKSKKVFMPQPQGKEKKNYVKAKSQFITFPNIYYRSSNHQNQTSAKIIYHVTNDAKAVGRKGVTHNEEYFLKSMIRIYYGFKYTKYVKVVFFRLPSTLPNY